MRRAAPLVAFLVALGWRICIFGNWPTAYAFDGYQRWAGRGHVLVQDWLPATQLVIWAVAKLGGGILEGRWAMSVVAAAAAAFGTLLVQRLADPAGGRASAVAGFSFVAAAVYGPWASWGTVFYQESTFIAVLFCGLWLAASGRLAAADIVIGCLGLVRYEGWPCILMYLAWRRSWRAGIAVWGMGLWVAIRAMGIEGYHASPVNFADWQGLSERFNAQAFERDAWMLGYRTANSCALTWIILAPIGLYAHRRSGIVWLIGLLFASQAAATLGWLAGLEVSTSRMLVIPTILAAILGCLGVAWADSWLKWKWIAPFGMLIIFGISLVDAGKRANVEGLRVRQERLAVLEMEDCPGCTWWVVPRRHLGTRQRHDGCEVIQGITNLLEGREFLCAPWHDVTETQALYATCSGTVTWDGATRAYVVERHEPGDHTMPAAPAEESEPAADAESSD